MTNCVNTVRIAGMAVLVMLVGCSHYQYSTPPTVAGGAGPRVRQHTGERVVVIGSFKNPAKAPLEWVDIGSGMSDSLANTLLNHGGFDVWIDPALGKQVSAAIEQSADRRERELQRLRKSHQNVDVVITGAVTDFTHSRDVPREVRRRGLFGRPDEAVVAIRMNVIDLKQGRVVASDHIHATVSAPDRPTREVYENIAFGSYLFWSTPLGHASKDVLGQANGVLNRVVPAVNDHIRIVKQIGPRRVRVQAASKATVVKGLNYNVCLVDVDGTHETVFDPLTGRPLKARVEIDGATATAWLIGEKPVEVDLRGAELCRDPAIDRMVGVGRARAMFGGIDPEAMTPGGNDV